MKISKLYLLFVLSFILHDLFAQENPFGSYNVPTPNITAFLKHVDVPIEMSRGIPDISIPIHTLGQGDIKIPISLSYNASGIKVGETASWVGMNWNLNAGGLIHRTIRGKPDEGNGGFFHTYDSFVFDYEEPSEFTLQEISSGYWDGEPDLFSFSFPGYSGKFYINSSMEPVLIPQQDLKIEFTYESSNIENERLTEFVITAPNGVKYYFGKNTLTGEAIVDFHNFEFDSGGNNIHWDHPVSWHLTKIESQTHNNIYYIEYNKQEYIYHSLFDCFNTFNDVIYTSVYWVETLDQETANYVNYVGNVSNTFVPFQITCSQTNESVQFDALTIREDILNETYGGNVSLDKGKRLDRIDIKNSQGIDCKRINFTYDYYETEDYNPSVSKFSDKRLRLLSMREESCDGSISNIPPYSFTYTSDILPSVTSRAIDHWGYYNGEHGNEYDLIPNPKVNCPPTSLTRADGTTMIIGNSNRDSNSDFMLQGVLETITFPTGGYHEYEFEANQYYDQSSMSDVTCGGLRLKRSEMNSVSDSPPIIKRYSYIKNGSSSGRLIQEPVYSKRLTGSDFQCALNGSCDYNFEWLLWNDGGFYPLTSFEGYHVFYIKVTESYENNSSKELQLSSWSDPQVNGGRFPIIPFTYRPGLGSTSSEKLFDASGNTVGESTYEYKRKQESKPEILTKTTALAYTVHGNDGQPECCQFQSDGIIFYSTYKMYSGYNLIEVKNTNLDGVPSKEEYVYRNDEEHLFPITHKFLDPQQGSAVRVTDIKYASEAAQTNFIASLMKSSHMIGVPHETRVMDGNGGGSKVEYNLIGNKFKPIKYYQAVSGSDYVMGSEDNSDWKLMVTATYDSGNDDFPSSIQTRNSVLPTIYDWNSYGYGLLASTTIGSRVWSNTYNSDRQLESMTDSEGIINEFTFDDIGRLTQSVLDKESINDSGREVNNIVYSYQGENKVVTTKSFEDGTPSLIFEEIFDGLGRSIENRKLNYTQSSQDYITSQSYNNVGLVAEKCDPSAGGCTLFGYESSPLQRVIYIKPGGSSKFITKEYETINTFQKITTYDENGNSSAVAMDILGRTRKKIDGFNEETNYVYTHRDLPSLINPPGGGIPYTYTYFDDGLLASKTIPDKGMYAYQYNQHDQIETEILPNNSMLNYEYDASYNSFLTIVRKDNSTLLNVYTPVDLGVSDRVLQEQNRILTPDGFGNWVTTNYNYYPLGYVENITKAGIDGSIVTSNYGYDSNGNIIEETTNVTGPDGNSLPELHKEYLYPKGVRLRRTDLSYGTNSLVLNELNYNNKEYLTSKKIGNGIQNIGYSYNYRGWLTKINSIQSTFDYENWCPPNQFLPCEPDRSSKLLKLEYNALKIANKSPTAINMTLLDYEHIGAEQLQKGSIFFTLPMNDYEDDKEFNPTDSKEIYLPENYNLEEVLLVVEEELSPHLTNYTSGEINNLYTTLELNIEENLSTTTTNKGKLFGMEIYYDSGNAMLNAPSQYNGNISWYECRVKGEEVHAYGFNYDANDRLTNAKYGTNTVDYCNIIASSNYDVNISGYDARGNILSLNRNGLVSDVGDPPVYGQIDDLAYNGYIGGSNLLNSVTEISNTKGFKETSNYGYDATGNLTSDSYKGITNIIYNHFDLPQKIVFADGQIKNFYDASGTKIKSIVEKDGENDITYHYLGVAEYKNSLIQSVYNEEGRYVYERSPTGNLIDEYFEYTLKDHLGNTRVRFADINDDGEIKVSDINPANDELLASNHYYPFGMEMEGSWELNVSGQDNKYAYNGKEMQDNLGLDLIDYGARFYDPAIARWTTVDNSAERGYFISPYVYGFNSPVRYLDPDGNWPWEAKAIRQARRFAKATGGTFRRYKGGAVVNISKTSTYYNIRNSYKKQTGQSTKDISYEEDRGLSVINFNKGEDYSDYFVESNYVYANPAVGVAVTVTLEEILVVLGLASLSGSGSVEINSDAIAEAVLQMAQRGNNDKRLEPAELEKINAAIANKTVTKAQLQKLKAHNKATGKTRSRKSGDKKKPKKKKGKKKN